MIRHETIEDNLINPSLPQNSAYSNNQQNGQTNNNNYERRQFLSMD
jgi:hypothetical protein